MSSQMSPYIMLDGKAQKAIQFYEQALEAKIIFMQTFGEGPENREHPMSADIKQRIAHSVLRIGDGELFVADSERSKPQQPGALLSICITTDNIDKTKAFYNSLQEGGQVNHPLEETYFSPAYGMVTDKFGVTFQISTKRG